MAFGTRDAEAYHHGQATDLFEFPCPHHGGDYPAMAESSGLTHTKTITDLTGAVQAWRQWLVSEKRASDHTLSAYERDLEQFLDFLQDHLGTAPDIPDLATLRPADFRGYLARRAAKGFAKSSTARALSVVRGFFRFLERRGVLTNAAVFAIRGPRIPVSVPKALTVTEAAETLDTMGDLASEPWIAARDVALVSLLYGGGLRIGEALALNRDDLPKGDTLTIMGKGKSSGSYQYCPPCAPPSTITLSAAPITADRTIRFSRRARQAAPGRCRPARHAVGTGLAESAGNRNAPRPEAFLCHPPVGRWWRSAGNSGTAWPCLTGDDSTLYQRRCGAADGCA